MRRFRAVRPVDVRFSFTEIVIALAWLAIFGVGLTSAMIAIGIAAIPFYARVTRSVVPVEKNKPNFEGAVAAGAGHVRLIFVHLLPNLMPTLIVIGTLGASRNVAVRGLSYTLNRGDTLAIVGESGSGKSTTGHAADGTAGQGRARSHGGAVTIGIAISGPRAGRRGAQPSGAGPARRRGHAATGGRHGAGARPRGLTRSGWVRPGRARPCAGATRSARMAGWSGASPSRPTTSPATAPSSAGAARRMT